MKKEIGLLVVGAMVLGATGTAFADAAVADSTADQLQVSGSFRYQYRDNQDKAFDTSSTQNNFQEDVNLSWKANANTTFFGRVAGENANFGVKAPANANDFTMDEYGIKTTMGGWTASIGRQDAQLGQGGTFAAGGISPCTYFDGVILTNKLADINFTALAGKTTAFNATAAAITGTSVIDGTTYLTGTAAAPATVAEERWVGLDLNKDVTKNINVGMAFSNSKVDDDTASALGYVSPTTGSSYSSVYGTLKSGAMTYTAEYVKSNATTDNKAADVSAKYQINAKNAFTVQYFDIQQNSVDLINSTLGGINQPNGSGFMGGYKGEFFSYDHTFNKTLSMNVQYYSLKAINAVGGANTTGTDGEVAASLKWAF